MAKREEVGMIEPGQTYDRAGVVALVLRKRSTPPDEWGNVCVKSNKHEGMKMPDGVWYDVYNLASDTNLPFHEPGQIVAWHESLFDESRCKRIG